MIVAPEGEGMVVGMDQAFVGLVGVADVGEAATGGDRGQGGYSAEDGPGRTAGVDRYAVVIAALPEAGVRGGIGVEVVDQAGRREMDLIGLHRIHERVILGRAEELDPTGSAVE